MPEDHIGIIESNEKNIHLLKTVLTNRGYKVSVATNGKQGMVMFSTNALSVVYLDMDIQDIDPMDVIREFKKRDLDTTIIALISTNAIQIIQKVLSNGVFDYAIRPLKIEEVYFKTQRAVMHRRYLSNSRRALKGIEERNVSLQKQNIMLAKRIEESTRNLTRLYEDLRENYMRTIKALAQAVDARDHYTHSHSENVSRYAEVMAKEMMLDTQKIEEIKEACQLHDLGKIGVHDYILVKPGKLTPEEFEEVKLHSLKGAQILEPLQFLGGVIDIVKQHHEQYDGKGYPFGLKGDQIDIGARIMSVADTYDAMVSQRPYRQNPLTKQEAIEEIKKFEGTQFDPKVVNIFLKVVNKF